jgi:hypothetical protein
MQSSRDLYDPDWRVRRLCTPDAIEAEENYLLSDSAHDELGHQEYVRRWQRLQSAKEWLKDQFATPVASYAPLPADSLPEKPTTTASNDGCSVADQQGCPVCLSAVCNCEDYKR